MGMIVNSYAVAATTPIASPHRYWRIYIGSNSDPSNKNNISLAEIEMRESVGGADVTGSGTATADSQFSGSFTPSMAFANDGNTTTWVSTVTTHPHWIAYDFGVGITKAIVEVAIMPRSSFTNQGPGAFKIQSSDDGTTWTDEWWVAYPGGTNGHGYADTVFKSFTKPVVEQAPTANRHRYWRLGITGSNGTGFVAAENVEFHVLVGGNDETEGGTASSTSNFAGLPPANAFDGMSPGNTSVWANNNVGFPENLIYDFGAANPKMIGEIAYYPRTGFESTQSPTGFTIDYSDNGSAWTTMRTVTGITGWVGGTPKVYSVP